MQVLFATLSMSPAVFAPEVGTYWIAYLLHGVLALVLAVQLLRSSTDEGSASPAP